MKINLTDVVYVQVRNTTRIKFEGNYIPVKEIIPRPGDTIECYILPHNNVSELKEGNMPTKTKTKKKVTKKTVKKASKKKAKKLSKK